MFLVVRISQRSDMRHASSHEKLGSDGGTRTLRFASDAFVPCAVDLSIIVYQCLFLSPIGYTYSKWLLLILFILRKLEIELL